VAKRGEVPMPDDWTDAAGWDAHHRSRLARPRDSLDDETGSIRAEQLPQLAADLKAQGWRSVWVPGCGLSPLAYLLAYLGLEVVATDVSPAAVQFQREAPARIGHLTARLGPSDAAGSFTAEVHDFRSGFRQAAFDLIINVKAFQAFSLPDMVTIAGVHAAALRAGRYAYFDTMNVQGERRDQLEQTLEDGGFVVPLLAVNRWYRQALTQTGIPHIFALGAPVIPRTGEYADGSPKWEADMARLREIVSEHRARVASEQDAERSRIGPEAKMAQVIYSTG
jgi:SAM-dependent methyltransferase